MSAPTVTKPIDTPPPVVGQNNLPPEAHGAVGELQPHRGDKLLSWIVPVMALLVGVLVVIPGLLQKWLWMRQLDYSEIFWTLLSVKWGMTCVAFIGAFLFLWINIRQAARNSFALAERDPATKAGSRGTKHVIEIRGILVSRLRADANHGIHRGWRGRDVCDRLLYAMGHVSPLSLRWFLRDVGPCLWN